MSQPNPDSTPTDDRLVAYALQYVYDPTAFEALISTWGDRIRALSAADAERSGRSALRENYGRLDGLLDPAHDLNERDAFERVVAATPGAAVVFDSGLRVIARNEAFGQLADAERAGHVNRDFVDDASRDVLKRFVAAAAAGAQDWHAILRLRTTTRAPRLAEIVLMRAPDTESCRVLVRELAFGWNEKVERLLAETFRLTAAETIVARMFLESADLESIALRRGVSIRTVRLQMSSIFSKTGAATQVELMRLLGALGAHAAERVARSAASWTEPTGRETVLMRPDGRRLAFSWLGDPRGIPAIYVPTLVSGYFFPPEFEERLFSAGVRLLVLHRPGLGNSDADNALEPEDDLARAIAWFGSALGLRKVPIVAQNAAAIAVLKLAAESSELVGAVLALGRFITYSAAVARRMPTPLAVFMWMAIHAPWAAEIVGKASLRAVRREGADWYLTRAYADLPTDRETVLRPEILPLMRLACDFSFAQGHKAFFADLRMRRIDFHPLLRMLDVPFHWMLGAGPIWSKRFGPDLYTEAEREQVAALNRHVAFEMVKDAGELLVYQQPALVAGRIAELALRGSTAGAGARSSDSAKPARQRSTAHATARPIR